MTRDLKKKIKFLKDFEEEISRIYEEKKIYGPIHLRNNNESELIKIFQGVNSEDYVFSAWASHLHALLKGIPADEVKKMIIEGNSITLTFPQYNFFTSAIVGGICPIATGVAWASKQKEKLKGLKGPRVWIFIGDMTAFTGIANESITYSINFDLPITWIIEDNKKSVGTPTKNAWNQDAESLFESLLEKKSIAKATNFDIKYYQFNSDWPHSGVGKFIEF